MAARTQVLVQQIESLKQQRSVEPDVSVRSKLTANIYAIRRQIGEQHSSQLHRQGARHQPHHPNMSSSQNRPFQHQHAGQRGNRIQPHPHQQQQQQQHHSAHAHSQAQRNRHIHTNHRAAHHHQHHPTSLHGSGSGSMPSMPNTHISPPRTRNPNHAQYNGNHNHNSLSAHSRDRRMERVSRHSNSNPNSASSSQRRNQANSSSHVHHSAHTTKHQHRSPAPLNRAHTTSHLPRNRTPNSGPRSGGSGGYRAHAHAHAHMSSSSYAPPSPLAAHPHPHPPSTQAHHPKPKKQTLLELVTRLELDTLPFAYDYRTSQNKTLRAQMSGLHGGEGWQQHHAMTTPPESDTHRNQNQTRAHMAPCLRLINTLMCMEEAIHFISPPNDGDTNPQLWQCFTSCDRNMCLEWIHSRLRCDYYETVGDFIADCALIWDNVYAVFGHAAGDDTCALKQEWIENAKLVQRQFLKRVVKIDTRIAGVDDIFIENGNPRLDPLQREFLSRAQVQTQIQTSLQKRQLQTPFPQMQQLSTQLSAQPPEGVHANTISSSNLSTTQPGESSIAASAEPKLLSEKEKRQQYLNNIDRDVTGSGTAYRRRKRQSKQTLRKSQSSSAAAADGDSNGKNDKSVSVETITSFVDAEEGEIKEALSKRQLFEVTVWWEFLQSFGETQCLQRVIMLQEGLRTTQAFEAYQRHMADKGHVLALDMSIVGGPLCVDEQCKIYSLLLKTVERITTQNRFAEQQLKAMLQERSKHKHVSSAWQFIKLPLQTSGGVVGGVGGESGSGSGRARMLDPYGNEAVQQRVKQKRSRDAMMMMANQNKTLAVGDEDEDEDDDFFDHLQCVPTTTTTTAATAQRSEMESGMQRQDTMNQEPRVIGKEQYDRNIAAYKPIKPNNIVHGDGDGDEDGDVEIATEMNEVEINDVDLAVWMSHERSADEDMKSCSPQLQGDDEFEHADIEEKNEDEPMDCNTDDKAQVTAQSSSDTVAWSKYSYNSEQAMSAVPDF